MARREISERVGAPPADGQRGTHRGNDPTRPERIAQAALQVVTERGVEGLTHRAVAAAACVPLGSTTYHFATLDDLLAVALRKAANTEVEYLRDWAAGLAPDVDFAAALTELVMRYLHEERQRTIVEYELYLAALHRPQLRAASTAWDTAVAKLFSMRTDPVTGRLLVATFCGLLMQVLSEPPPTRDETEALFRQTLSGTARAT